MSEIQRNKSFRGKLPIHLQRHQLISDFLQVTLKTWLGTEWYISTLENKCQSRLLYIQGLKRCLVGKITSHFPGHQHGSSRCSVALVPGNRMFPCGVCKHCLHVVHRYVQAKWLDIWKQYTNFVFLKKKKTNMLLYPVKTMAQNYGVQRNWDKAILWSFRTSAGKGGMSVLSSELLLGKTLWLASAATHLTAWAVASV